MGHTTYVRSLIQNLIINIKYLFNQVKDAALSSTIFINITCLHEICLSWKHHIK